MTNKEKLKASMNKDFTKEYNYTEIIEKVEGENMKDNNNLWKWVLVPICLIVVVGGLLFINSKNTNNNLSNSHTTYNTRKNNITLNINDIEKMAALKLDAVIKEIPLDDRNTPWLESLKDNIKIPKYLDQFDSYSIYTRKDETSEYNILNCYVYNYSNKNESDHKNIHIAFSNTNKPLRDYHFSEEGSKDTIINNIKLKIYKYEEIYFAEFKYKEYNFDIETSNINEGELIELLSSTIK